MRFFLNFGTNMRSLKALLLAGGMLCVPLLAHAEPLRISPAEAVDLAARNNLGLESARISTAMSRRASELAWNQFVPEAMVSGSLLRMNNAPVISGLAPVPETAVMPGGPMMVMPFAVDGPRWLLNVNLSASLNFQLCHDRGHEQAPLGSRKGAYLLCER